MDAFLSTETLQEVREFLAKEGLDWGINILAAIAIFIIGKWVAKKLVGFIERAMLKSNVDKTLASFLGNILNVLALAFVVIAALSKLGVETTSLAAIFAAAGLAIGLSLQGSLSNLAAGVMIISFRPFKSGDFIEAAGIMGVVEEINIFTTRMRSADNKEIIVPNGSLINGVITNYSARDTRRVDMVFGIGYNDDLRRAKDILQEMVANDDRVLPEPEPMIMVNALGESSVDIAVRPWVKAADYWPLYWDFMENVKLRFDAEGISIPFPQRDVHMYHINAEPAQQAA